MVFAGQEIRVNDSFGPLTTFTPSWINLTLGNGSTAGEWRRMFDFMIWIRAQFTFGSTTSTSGPLGLTLPGSLSGEASTVRQHVPIWAFDSSASQGFVGTAVLQSGGGANLDRFYGPTSSAGWQISGGIPLAWASGDIILVEGMVRVTS